MSHVELVDLISQFRMMIYQNYPYLAPYIYSLTPVERPGLGTMAVDKYGRMYYDPAWSEALTLEQGGYVVCHEAWHLILRHCHRASKIIGDNPTPKERYLLNVAMDIVVWEMMEATADQCPEGGVTFDKAKEQWPKIERNMTIEQLYSIISEQQAPPPDLPRPGDEQDEQDEQEEQEREEGGDFHQPGEEQSEESDNESEDQDGDGEPRDSDPGEKDGGKVRGKGDEDGTEDGTGSGGEQDSDEDFDRPFDVNETSAADGQPRDYEEEPDHAWDAFKEDRLLESIEKKIEELEEDRDWIAGRGTIPAGLKRLIKDKLHPQPNPWDCLRATVAKALANHRGCPDYTYQRPNRRQESCRDLPRLKGLKKYAPKAVVIVDTSGSMTAGCLAKALTVIKQGLKAIGNIPVVTCDAQVHQDKVLTSVQEQFELVGGGGTDMRVPIEYTQDKYKPDVTVLVTDTGTPWPDKPIKGQLIVAATQDGFVPPWATKVRIPDSPNKTSLEDDE